MTELSSSVRWSVKIYRRLLQAYPDAFRRAFGKGMVEVFADMATDAWRRNGLCGLVFMWFRVLGDLASSVVSEYGDSRNGGPEMKTAFYLLASVVLATVVQMFVMGAIGIVIVSLSLISAESIAEHPIQGVLELLLFFLPPFFAAMLLMHTKPFYRPWLTAPLGAMAFYTFAFLADSNAPWWAVVGFAAIGGLLSLAGCFAGSRIRWRRGKEAGDLAGVVE
jgi:hypothetical protein